MKFIPYIFLLFVGSFTISCTDKITLDLEDPEPVLVVDGYLSDIYTVQTLKLSNLENYFADGSPDLTIYKNATVKLIENGTEVDTYNFNTTTNQFELNYAGIAGNQYQIDIILPDGSHYLSSEEEMYQVPDLDSVTIDTENFTTGPGTSDSLYNFNIFTQETPGTGDTYQWKTYVNNTYQYEPSELSFADDRFVDGQYVEDFSVWSIFGEDLLDKTSDTPNDPIYVTIEQSQITYRYYEFLTLVLQQTLFVGGPFASPPAEIRGNVYKLNEENETLALGYFYTASISSQTVEVKL